MLLDHTADWHAARRQGVGGSDAGAIMSGDWLSLWEEKTGRREPEDLSRVLPVQLGSYTEAFNLAWFEQETGIPVSCENCDGLTHPLYDWMRANLDGRCDGAIFEAKHVSAFKKPEEIIERYYPQLQHCMAVAGAELAYLSVIYGNHKWEYYPVEADADYQARLIEREEAFWSHVQSDTPPEAREAIVASVAFDDMREADMSGSNAWATHAADWRENKAAAKLFKDAEKELKALVEADVKRAHGAGIEIKRAKNGALSIREQK